jgi:hypothetical protein
MIASATVARLQAEPVFRTDLASAKRELAAAKAPEAATCAVEGRVLADRARPTFSARRR